MKDKEYFIILDAPMFLMAWHLYVYESGSVVIFEEKTTNVNNYINDILSLIDTWENVTDININSAHQYAAGLVEELKTVTLIPVHILGE